MALKDRKALNVIFLYINSNDKETCYVRCYQKNLQFEKNKVRTADINPMLLKITSVNESFRGNKNGTNQDF